MREKAWQREDIVTNASKGYDSFEEALVETRYWTQQFLNGYWACQTFILDEKIGTDANKDEIFFHLNRSMLYAYYIHAPEYFIQNYNPLALPNNYGKLFPAKVVMMLIFTVIIAVVVINQTRLTYNCAHLRSTKESLTVEFGKKESVKSSSSLKCQIF